MWRLPPSWPPLEVARTVSPAGSVDVEHGLQQMAAPAADIRYRPEPGEIVGLDNGSNFRTPSPCHRFVEHPTHFWICAKISKQTIRKHLQKGRAPARSECSNAPNVDQQISEPYKRTKDRIERG